MAQRLNTHRKLALLMFGGALLIIGGIINHAMASDLVDYDPLADPLMMQEIAQLIMQDYDPTVAIHAQLIADLPQDGMALVYAVDAERARISEIRQAQIAHGVPVSTSGSASLLIGGIGVIGGFLYLRWRRKHPARKPIWAWRRGK